MGNPIIEVWNKAQDGETKEEFIRFLISTHQCVLIRELLKELDSKCHCVGKC